MTPTGHMVVSSTKTDKHRIGMPTDVIGKIFLVFCGSGKFC